jgi:hypothetical protein
MNEFSESPKISSFIKIRPVGAELFHADGRTHDEANSRFFAILRTRLKAINCAK